MAVVALRLAAEQLVARLLLRRELRLAREHCIELRGEGRHLGRGLVAGDGLGHLVECRGSPSAIKLAEMDRHRIVGRWRARLVADLLDVFRPPDGKGLFAPYRSEERRVGKECRSRW